MSKHTPGPWTAEDNSWETSTVYANGKEVARCYIDGEADEYNQDRFERIKGANARLIAAAPELLAELQNIADADPRKWDEETRDQFQQWAQSRARFAIAKATGGEA